MHMSDVFLFMYVYKYDMYSYVYIHIYIYINATLVYVQRKCLKRPSLLLNCLDAQLIAEMILVPLANSYTRIWYHMMYTPEN